MILRSFLWALGLFTAYNVAVALAGYGLESRAEAFFLAEEEWHKVNLLRAQNAVAADLTGRDVYLGSSLGNTLPDEWLARPYQKLCFIGGSPLTGLLLLEKSGERPRRVFVETNYLLARRADETLLGKVGGWRGWIVSRLPAARVAFRPVDLALVALFGPDTSPAIDDIRWEEQRRLRTSAAIAPDESVIDEEHKKRMKDVWSREFLKRRGPEKGPLPEEVKRVLKVLESRGIGLVFYHMPVDPDIAATGHYPRMQSMIEEAFPRDHYRWVEPDPAYAYRTIDGFHLTPPSREAYARHLVLAAEEK